MGVGVAVTLAPARVPVEPGTNATLTVTVHNTDAVVQQYALEVLGPAAAWTTVEPANIGLFPDEVGTATVHFKPPRSSAVRAGPLTFGLKTTPATEPDGSVVKEGIVDIGSFVELSAEIRPRTSRSTRIGAHRIVASNHGNAPLEVLADPDDPDEILKFDLDPERAVIPAGQAEVLQLQATAPTRFMFGPMRRIPFEVTVKGEGTAPVRLDAALQQRALLGGPAMRVFVGVLLLAVVAGFVLLTLGNKATKHETLSASHDVSTTTSSSTTTSTTVAPTSSSDTTGGGGGGGGGGGRPTTPPTQPAAKFVNKLLPDERWGDTPSYGSRGTYEADVNGDKKADTVMVSDSGISVRLSDGKQFTSPAAWTPGASYGNLGRGVEDNAFADVNGDGKADDITVDSGDVGVRLSDGKSFGNASAWVNGPAFGAEHTLFADVTGDGKADLVAVNEDAVYVSRSTGRSFGPPEKWTAGAFIGSSGMRAADVDGDHKADLIAINGGQGIFVARSDGNHFLGGADFTGGPFDGDFGWEVADVNGDGKVDALIFTSDAVVVRPSDGKHFASSQVWTPSGYRATAFFGNRGTAFADVNGDGRADRVAVNQDGLVVDRSG